MAAYNSTVSSRCKSTKTSANNIYAHYSTTDYKLHVSHDTSTETTAILSQTVKRYYRLTWCIMDDLLIRELFHPLRQSAAREQGRQGLWYIVPKAPSWTWECVYVCV